MSPPAHPLLRLLFPVALLVGAGVFLHVRGQVEVIPQRQGLTTFPVQIGAWQGRDLPLDSNIREALGPGEFLFRDYFRSSASPPVNLFLAYFPSQRTGDTIHSPKNCLPGAGWAPLKADHLQLSNSAGKLIVVNRHVIAKGLDRQLVVYWYQAHGRIVASEYWAKFYLVADAILLNRSDGALVRIITPLIGGEDEGAAEQRVVDFAQGILPELSNHIPQ